VQHGRRLTIASNWSMSATDLELLPYDLVYDSLVVASNCSNLL
jgi:hypothetical protein